jgi:hypothetical protein
MNRPNVGRIGAVIAVVLSALVCRAGLETEFRSANLPPLLEFADGRPVRTLAEWSERRAVD